MQGDSIENNPSFRAAFYARVSSDQQAESGTIGSQVAALERRAAADQVRIEVQMRFIDEGHSGSTLVRPALEKLRDRPAVRPVPGSLVAKTLASDAAD